MEYECCNWILYPRETQVCLSEIFFSEIVLTVCTCSLLYWCLHDNPFGFDYSLSGFKLEQDDLNDFKFLWNRKTFCSLPLLQWHSFPTRWSLSNWFGSLVKKKKELNHYSTKETLHNWFSLHMGQFSQFLQIVHLMSL